MSLRACLKCILKSVPSVVLGVGLALCLSGCGPGGGSSGGGVEADYPSRSVTLICPWAAGGGTDRLSRFMADQLQKSLGQPVVVVNRTGGSGAVGHSAGALAKPDGYTITMGTFELSTMHWMGITDLTWTDYESVIQLNADAAAILVRKDAPWKTLGQLVEHVRENPGKLKMSGTATGGAWDLARAGFLLAAGLPVDSVLWVPAQGAAPSVVELLGGHIDAVCCSVPEAAAQIEAGELIVLGVMAPERLEQFPEIPTVREQGVDWEAVGWRGLILPKETPEGIVDRLSAAARGIVESEAFQEFMEKNGFAVSVRGPEEFARFLEAQDQQWQRVIEAAGYARE
jgi:tripartite-type tricarboxylate transporter receptor subunit TctC